MAEEPSVKTSPDPEARLAVKQTSGHFADFTACVEELGMHM